MSDFILPNTDNKEYGLVIDQERFKDFVKDIFDKPISHMPDINHLELVTKASSRTNFDDKVYDIFKIKFEREGNKYFYPPKKISSENEENSSYGQSIIDKIYNHFDHYI